MVPFILETELAGIPVTITVEQVDRLADGDGYIRYDVTNGMRRAVIFVNVEDQRIPLGTEQDAAAHFEALHYPDYMRAFSLEDDFSAEDVTTIAHAIREHDRELQFTFNKFMNRSIFPDL
jgi:hypothetical protein